MTDERHAFWLNYFRTLADLMGLRDWNVILWRDPCPPDSNAVVSCTEGARSLVVNLAREWEQLAPEEQRRVAVHELTHPHFQEIDEHVREASNRFSDNSLMQYLPALVEHEIEHAVDAISVAFARFLPLPEAA